MHSLLMWEIFGSVNACKVLVVVCFRYLLQPIALEIFSSDGRNYLLALPRKLRNKTYQRFVSQVC